MASYQDAPTGNTFKLKYFPVMAKGLGPALVANHSGLHWQGSTDPAMEAMDYKKVSPFGQCPLMLIDGMVVSQTTAIINLIGAKAGTDGRNDPQTFARSQMLIAEGEDLVAALAKFNPTVFRSLECSKEEHEGFWSKILPGHLGHLEKLVSEPITGTDSESVYTTGELYVWSYLHQAVLCRPSCLKPFHNVSEFYAAVLAHPRTKEVLNGTSPMGELKQYIITLEAAKARAPSRSSAGSVMGMDLSGLGEPRMLLSVGLGLAIGMTAAHLLPCAAGGKAR